MRSIEHLVASFSLVFLAGCDSGIGEVAEHTINARAEIAQILRRSVVFEVAGQTSWFAAKGVSVHKQAGLVCVCNHAGGPANDDDPSRRHRLLAFQCSHMFGKTPKTFDAPKTEQIVFDQTFWAFCQTSTVANHRKIW